MALIKSTDILTCIEVVYLNIFHQVGNMVKTVWLSLAKAKENFWARSFASSKEDYFIDGNKSLIAVGCEFSLPFLCLLYFPLGMQKVVLQGGIWDPVMCTVFLNIQSCGILELAHASCENWLLNFQEFCSWYPVVSSK